MLVYIFIDAQKTYKKRISNITNKYTKGVSGKTWVHL